MLPKPSIEYFPAYSNRLGNQIPKGIDPLILNNKTPQMCKGVLAGLKVIPFA